MKKLLFYFAFTSLSFTVNSQNTSYRPMISPLNEWICDNDNILFSHPKDSIIRFSFSSDSTLIGGKYYRQVVYGYNASGELKSKGDYYREEQGKVYVYGLFNTKSERLVFDMNFNVGDTLAGINNIAQPVLMISEVGTYLLSDNVPRKYYISETATGCGQKVIEGMGSLDYFFNLIPCGVADGVVYPIRCFSTNGQMLYHRKDVGLCFSTATKEVTSVNFSVFPNPTEGNITMQYEALPYTALSWNVYDCLGKLVFKKSLQNDDNQSTTNIDFLQNGAYFWELRSAQNTLSKGRLILMK